MSTQSAIRNPQSAISKSAACVWFPLFALRLEEARRPELAGGPVALLAPDTSKRVWQVSPRAHRAGVRPGMTVSRAVGLCPTLRLCEADPVHYDAVFAELVAALGRVSPVIEVAELGRVFVGTDGLEGLWGGTERIVEAINGVVGGDNGVVSGKWFPPIDAEFRSTPTGTTHHSPRSHRSHRLGWGRGKFVSWTAASRARPGQHVIVAPGEERAFLAAQPLAVLPLDAATHQRLRRLGLRTLGDLAALPEDAVAAQFGDEGRRLWRLAAGRTLEPVTGRPAPEPVAATLAFYTPVADRALLGRALDVLIDRALASPARAGWCVQAARVRAVLEHGGSWGVAVTLREPTASRAAIAAPLAARWGQAPPAGAVERLTVEFTAFTPGTTALQLFARDASAAARAGRRRALRAAAREIHLRMRRPMLYRVIDLEPWSRLPERRHALIDVEP
jgi:DNA polymerase-4/protein ImuB